MTEYGVRVTISIVENDEIVIKNTADLGWADTLEADGMAEALMMAADLTPTQIRQAIAPGTA